MIKGGHMNQDVLSYSIEYKKFLNAAKTERLCVTELAARLEASGFKKLDEVSELKPGDRVYRNVKGRTLLAAVIGRSPERLRIVGSHVDSPKLDLKPEPLFEEGGMVLLKLHDYGWIKPYQWVNVPLELRGIIYDAAGRKHELALGARPGDPVLCIPDIPPHISGEQMKRPMEEGFSVAQLNALIAAALPSSAALEAVLASLKRDYGLERRDFSCADLSLVPHQEAIDVGLGGELLGGYGHDDRSCVFAALAGLLGLGVPERSALGYFVDKEEVASTGDTSAQSVWLRSFVSAYARKLPGLGLGADELLEAAQSISADVTTAFDPNFPDKFDPVNIARLGHGVAVEKYGAAGSGKFRAHEARAEYMQTIRETLEAASVPWQTGTLARLGVGGGGTIAAFMTRAGMDCVDAGPCLLGMHSPFEVGSKEDFYNCYRFYARFLAS
jgi:aspartyl aminopeptidase